MERYNLHEYIEEESQQAVRKTHNRADYRGQSRQINRVLCVIIRISSDRYWYFIDIRETDPCLPGLLY